MKKKQITVLLGFMVMALVTIPQSANAGACRAGDDGCITAKDIAFNAISTTRIVDGAITDVKISGTISASKIEKQANVIVVAQSGGDYTSIQAAIDSLTTPNTTPTVIKVMPGTYAESITMQSYIHLQGAGMDITTVKIGDDVISLNGVDNASITGFTLDCDNFVSATAIWNVASSPNISENNIIGCTWGIYNEASSETVISRNVITPLLHGYGILNDSSTSTIKDNLFNLEPGSGDVTGIRNQNNSSAVIVNNEFKGLNGCDMGIKNNNSQTKIIGNIMTGMGCYGIDDRYQSSSEIIGNTISGEGDLIFLSQTTSIVSGNIISGSSYKGLYLDNNTSATITNNKIANNTIDIYNSGCTNCNISFNVFDTIQGTLTGSFNTKPDGTQW